MHAILDYNPDATARPFRVHFPNRTAAYSTFATAVTAARFACDTQRPWPTSPKPAPHGDPLTRPAPKPAPIQKDESSKNLNPECVNLARGVFRIRGRRGDVLIARDIVARGRDAAIRAFLALTDADRVESTRALTRRDPDATSARVRKGTAMLASKRRRQVSVAWTRQLTTK